MGVPQLLMRSDGATPAVASDTLADFKVSVRKVIVVWPHEPPWSGTDSSGRNVTEISAWAGLVTTC